MHIQPTKRAVQGMVIRSLRVRYKPIRTGSNMTLAFIALLRF